MATKAQFSSITACPKVSDRIFINDKGSMRFDNLGDFRDRLREAELLVHASGALLPHEEYTQLVGPIEKFQSFQVGKADLLRT